MADLGSIASVWQVQQIGDFTGNGISDILWRNSDTGDTGIDLMTDASVAGWSDLSSIGSVWSVARTVPAPSSA